MELNDSSDSKPETRSPLGIDLNEIPSSSFAETLPDEPDSLEVVRAFHDNPDPAPGEPARVPGEPAECGACGGSEAAAAGRVVVCDGCERGFHLACTGIPGLQWTQEWVCAECVSRGERSKRWPLGLKAKKRILDINASPPSDGDGDGECSEEVLRKHTPVDKSFVSNGCGAPVTLSNLVYAGNGFGFHKASSTATHSVKMGFEEIFHHTQTMSRSFNELDLEVQLGKLRGNSNAAIRFPSWNPGDKLLQALRELVSESHGVLEEGWRVELKQSLSGYEPYAVYRAPDGKTFDSMFEVASYLGLHNSMNAKVEGARPQERLPLQRKRKSTRFSFSNGFSENNESLTSGYSNEFSCGTQGLEKSMCKSAMIKVTDGETDEKASSASEQTNNGLPVKFEDFFVLTLGQVDMRPSYHDNSLIYPIGYRSCWHDKITGSLFMCEVLDGGDLGPIFKVKRCPCSAMSIPTGSIVLVCPVGQRSEINEDGIDITCYDRDCENDGNIQMIISDPCPPMENDLSTCLDSGSKETYNLHSFDRSHFESSLGLTDELGEISVEEHSSSSAWKVMSQKLFDACLELCKKKGVLKFFCKHGANEMGSINQDLMNEKNKGYVSLAKFCSYPVPLTIQSQHQSDELEILAGKLTEWLGQDRFGLDAEFVQEIIEMLPGVDACSKYEFLKKRSSYSTSLTVGSGLLMVETKAGLDCKEEKGSDGLLHRSKKPKLVHDRGPPPGKPSFLRLPPGLVGDFHQVWELLWRFHEILGLKEPFVAEELEEQLINPWFSHSSFLNKVERKIQENEILTSQKMDHISGQVSSSNEYSLPACEEHSHPLTDMETEAIKEAVGAKFASLSYSKHFGVALTKAHISLLVVLISELQSKVAALVDPNFDSGESRSKRGRKKDSDGSISAKRIKLSKLPVNELTWPELARRYVLAVLSMDCNLDSAEVTARESSKVFRCLQGDGGVLCGSRTGVAGIEADAHMLAEATKRILGALNAENDVLTIEEECSSDVTGSCEKNIVNDDNIPEWAQKLLPVRKLPTNVGTRIRKCVYDALEKNPPEWAKKILEHSISKEVYKGNASGPTKKAVLSLLADVQNKGLVQKPEGGRSKKKTVVSMSEVIMKQCRIVLRRAAAADDSKVFCNLLGRKLMNSSDNDDEGLLGSPAMVARPLDFRTIDLRLAVGAYGRSHEAFLEDVHELWSNVHTAFSDQPDLVDLAESLSQNFESLYEKEVSSLVKKFADYSKLECLSTETKKEINEILASTNEIPKAPWDEGVCKVCGIDRDDDSVLLCDTCDAEYHTYCLNPPLARIPEGNWYCPTCAINKRMVQDASECSLVISRRKDKKYLGAVIRGYLDELARLAAVMEDKEYWEFSLDERTFLLKFLCDELLNSTLIRQHLEQSAETTSELQQKLRSSYAELKNLKSREDFLASRAVRIDMGILNASGEAGMRDGVSSGHMEHGKQIGQAQSHSIFLDDHPPLQSEKEGTETNGCNKDVSATCTEKNSDSDSQLMNHVDTEAESNGSCAIVDESKVPSQKCGKSITSNELPSSNNLPKEVDDSGTEIFVQGNLQESKERDDATPPTDHDESCLQSDKTDVPSLKAAQCVSPVADNESQGHNVELNTIKSDIKHLQDLIVSLETQILKSSLRREFMGCDSGGRMYWISAAPGGYLQVISDGCLAMKQRRNLLDYGYQDYNSSAQQNFATLGSDTHLKLEGSKACCPFLYNSSEAHVIGSPCVSYQTDSEIEELINWLNDNDPKERELKEAIWQKLRFQDSHQMKNQDQNEKQQSFFSMSTTSDGATFSSCLVTKAAMLLQKYGSYSESEITNSLKKMGKRARLTNEEKMNRCGCLELIWPSRNHCLTCHRTFFTDVELQEHNNGRCDPGAAAKEKSSEINDSLKKKGNGKSDSAQVDCTVDMDRVETSRVIKFQNEEAPCPYDFEEINSKFFTRDSNEELVHEIGLISSSGIPSFIPSPFSCESMLISVPPQEVSISGNEFEATENVFSHGKKSVANGGNGSLSNNPSRKSVANEICEVQKTNRVALKCLEQRDRISSSDRHSTGLGSGRCFVVPPSSLRPLVGKASQVLRQLKINLLDMDAALPEEALRPSKAHLERRQVWRSFVKSAETIYEMVQATILLEDLIKTEHLRNEWWYWSSLSAAARISTVSSLALRIYSLDAAIIYEKSNFDPIDNSKPSSVPDPKLLSFLDPAEKCKVTRKSGKKRKESEG
ncbi:hypothetical protein SLEP1_g19422 [Rubroshorea leprosula]|uniref:Methyl-CpG-binding domain-containing protein 9 n=1 Tax=Rubroshorea leprosula TaxID=152421 RepID=A0AAV5J9W9_9ROSI|nr:hypothetical protein SLEP1_g19422 [Rubroshorea leprosula]